MSDQDALIKQINELRESVLKKENRLYQLEKKLDVAVDKVERVVKLFEGNGRPSIAERLIKLEENLADTDERARDAAAVVSKLVWTVVGTTMTAIITLIVVIIQILDKAPSP